MKRKNIIILSSLLLMMGIYACRKEIKKIFEVQTQQISQTTIDKDLLKAQIEFISMAYSDLFGKNIPEAELRNCLNCFAGSSDKELITDRIIRSYINNGNLIIPSVIQMHADIPAFVKATYNKFLHRPPSEMELYKMGQMIQNDSKITPEIIYFSMLTCNEYKFK